MYFSLVPDRHTVVVTLPTSSKPRDLSRLTTGANLDTVNARRRSLWNPTAVWVSQINRFFFFLTDPNPFTKTVSHFPTGWPNERGSVSADCDRSNKSRPKYNEGRIEGGMKISWLYDIWKKKKKITWVKSFLFVIARVAMRKLSAAILKRKRGHCTGVIGFFF